MYDRTDEINQKPQAGPRAKFLLFLELVVCGMGCVCVCEHMYVLLRP